MLPDVIEMDEIRSGKRREALFYSMFLLTEKFGVAFAQAISSYLLGLCGYLNPYELEGIYYLSLIIFFVLLILYL